MGSTSLMLRPGIAGPLFMILSLCFACEERKYGSGGSGVASEPVRAQNSPAHTSGSTPEKTEANQKPEAPQKSAGEEDGAPPDGGKYAALTTHWGLGELHDLGPAGPATAAAQGAVFITRNDHLLWAKRSGETFASVALPASEFAKYGRGPSISGTHAYWISENGHLLRGDLKDGKVESLFDHARPGTRSAVQSVGGRDVVAFVAQVGENPMAHAWVSHESGTPEILQLSPDGSTATSVTLVAGKPHPRAIILEGRTSMSPVHARTIRVTPRRVTLAPDEVVWVGPPSHVLTEIHAISQANGDCTAFLPTAKDFNDFGLAQLAISKDGGECPAPGWQIFPNGLDPAPVATGFMCNDQYLLFARPSEEHPRSPQELHVTRLSGTTPTEGEIIARSRAFNDVSLAPIPGGAVVVWTADKRTWGMLLHCPKN
jgi:hypothetical protein